MPRRRFTSLVLFVLAAIVLLQLTGCTAVGFGVGAFVDGVQGKGEADRLATVSTGKDITMWLNNGRKLQGRYLGSRDSLSATPLPVPAHDGPNSVQPVRSVILIETNDRVEQIAALDVRRVSVSQVSGKWIGLCVGMILDGLTILLAAAATSQFN